MFCVKVWLISHTDLIFAGEFSTIHSAH